MEIDSLDVFKGLPACQSLLSSSYITELIVHRCRFLPELMFCRSAVGFVFLHPRIHVTHMKQNTSIGNDRYIFIRIMYYTAH